MTSAEYWNAYAGAIVLSRKSTLPKIWQWLHDNATQWEIMSRDGESSKNLLALDRIDRETLGLLGECPAEAWLKMCSGTGATQMGAVGLSWCRDARLADVWDMWTASQVPLKPTPVYRRPARMLNPALVGDETSLRRIVDRAKSDIFTACVHAARAGQNIVIDIPTSEIRTVPSVVASFVLYDLQRAPKDGPVEREFTAYWSGRISRDHDDARKSESEIS